jgi:hypothetical protein
MIQMQLHLMKKNKRDDKHNEVIPCQLTHTTTIIISFSFLHSTRVIVRAFTQTHKQTNTQIIHIHNENEGVSIHSYLLLCQQRRTSVTYTHSSSSSSSSSPLLPKEAKTASSNLPFLFISFSHSTRCSSLTHTNSTFSPNLKLRR